MAISQSSLDGGGFQVRVMIVDTGDRPDLTVTVHDAALFESTMTTRPLIVKFHRVLELLRSFIRSSNVGLLPVI